MICRKTENFLSRFWFARLCIRFSLDLAIRYSLNVCSERTFSWIILRWVPSIKELFFVCSGWFSIGWDWWMRCYEKCQWQRKGLSWSVLVSFFMPRLWCVGSNSFSIHGYFVAVHGSSTLFRFFENSLAWRYCWRAAKIQVSSGVVKTISCIHDGDTILWPVQNVEANFGIKSSICATSVENSICF